MESDTASTVTSSEQWSYGDEADLIALDPLDMPVRIPAVKVQEAPESEDDEDINSSNQPAESGRVQNNVFSAWLSRRAEQTTAEDLEGSLPKTSDEQLSIHALMAKHESTAIIGNPREYQMELFEKAKKQNIIAVLDTGSGKTLIAVLLLKYILDQELEDRANGKNPKVAFFLVDKVALCFQQFAVLEANLDQTIERLYGDTKVDSFSRAEWDRILTEKKVVVCTAAILDQALGKAYISMKQINLLIFDEAHHTKKNHDYAKIIKNFYLPEKSGDRPRIFGMTASPIDAREDVEEAASRLEALLHCQIATTANGSLSHYHSRPIEIHLTYERCESPYLTSLGIEMENQYSDVKVFKDIFRNSKEAASELGEWCADRFWAMAFSEDESLKFENNAEREFHAHPRQQPVELLDKDVTRIKEARKLIENHTFEEPLIQGKNVSSKVQVLNDFLFHMYLEAPKSRTLVFVKKRCTAWLLAEILRKIGSPNIHIGVLVGMGGGGYGEPNTSIRQQMVTIHQFRNGAINLLIATSVAEEGLDIPDCNCVIRFDLFTTMIQYVQSRGRARHYASKFVSMTEEGNADHQRVLDEVRIGELKMRQFCNALPEDRILKGSDYDLDEFLLKEKRLPIYIDKETGAKLTFHSALMTLEYFVASIPRDDESLLKADYIISYDGRGFLCEVILPSQAPIRAVIGRSFPKKSLAKRSAAFEMCLLLRRSNYLNKDLMPIYHKQLPAMRNAHLALNVKTTNSYPMRMKPERWESERGTVPDKLYLTIIGLDEMVVLGQRLVPLGLLSRSPLIQFPEFSVFPKADGHTNVISRSLQQSILVSAEILQQMTNFTLQMYYDVFNKKFENEPANMSYWLAPLLPTAYATIRSSHVLCSEDIGEFVDWHTLAFVHNNPEIAWQPHMTAADLENQYLVDKWDGGRRFFSERLVPYMRPHDPVPAGCAPAKYNSSILEYSISLFSRSRVRALNTWAEDQPVLQARRVLHRRNWLDEWEPADKTAKTLAYVCPEPLRISSLPSSVAAMSYVFPAIIHRFEEYLISSEAAGMLGLTLTPALALEAMTKDSDNTEEHRLEQVQFQRGMGKNYERLEFIGDTFLKMATSIALYASNASDDEFESHVKRMLMICNKNLFNHAVRCKLYEYVRTRSFSRRTWYPEGLMLLEGKGKNMNNKKSVARHKLNDKSIADVCEALIGAALLSPEDPNDMDMAVRAVTVMVQSSDHTVDSFAAYSSLYQPPLWQLSPATAAQLDLVAQLSRLGYTYQNARLLRSAFTHPSHPFSRERVPSYQRLEFLGDALLDMACVRWLYERHPHRDPQWLTEHKMAMVSNQFLGALCVQLGLHRHLKHSHGALVAQIAEYASAFAEEKAEAGETALSSPAASDGDAGAEKGSMQMDFWLHLPTPPKCLADVVEAYVGALFVDSQFSYTRVVAFVTTHIAPFFVNMALYDEFAHTHPGAALQRLLSTPPLRCNSARVLAAPLPTMDGYKVDLGAVFAAAAMVHESIVATAEAPSARVAKAKASAGAVELLKGMDRMEFVRRFKCDCREDGEDGEENAESNGHADERITGLV
jgi:endoribonuclease Dicer